MEAIPRKYGEWSQFDRYCKLVLYHEAIDYLREMKCRRDREVSLDAVSPADWDKLSTVDRYSCDSFTFSSHGYDLHIDNELVAEAFATITGLLYCGKFNPISKRGPQDSSALSLIPLPIPST